MVNFLKSQTLTAYFSNTSSSYVTSNFHEDPNLNRLFLKLIWFMQIYLSFAKKVNYWLVSYEKLQ